MKNYIVLSLLVLAISDFPLLRHLHEEIETVLSKQSNSDLKLGSSVSSPISFTDCGGEQGTITKVDVEPNPLIIGKSATLKITGATKSAFQVTKLSATAYSSGIPISTQEIQMHQSCPKGSCSFTQSGTIPNIIPSGTYEIEIKAQNDKSDNLVCGKATLEVKKAKIDTLEDNVAFQDCGGSKVTITSVNIQPYPPKIGNKVTVTAKGTASEAFKLSKLKAIVYVSGVPLTSGTAPASSSCDSGSCTLSQSIVVPSIVPPGTYDVQVQGQNEGDSDIVCFKITVEVKKMLRDPISFTDCGGELAQVKTVDVNPYPPIIGKPVSLEVTGNANKQFSINKLVATVYTQGVPISTQTISMSASCPSQGSCSLTHTINVPSIVPEGNYEIEVKAQNGETQNAICGKASIDLKKPSKRYENSIDFTDCGGDQGTITSVEITPYPPSIGQDVSIEVKGKTKSAFKITKLKTTAYVAGIPLASENVPVSISCPAGTCTISKSLNVPSSVPPGTYMVEIQAQNNEDQNLICVKGHVEIK